MANNLGRDHAMSESADADRFRQLPSVNEVVDSPSLLKWLNRVSRDEIVAAARNFLAECRQAIKQGFSDSVPTTVSFWAAEVEARLESTNSDAMVPVINGTGILLHTGLGRAPLAQPAVEALAAIAGRYVSLEIDLRTGERGSRALAIRRLLTILTGAESATIVNNNAAALLLVLSTLARGRRVVVSRGELIEIGGSFRLPEIMAVSGVELLEVGTTNKTHLEDYAASVDGRVAALLKVHPSNYQISGFTQSVSVAELSSLAHRKNVPLIHDIGSGALVDLTCFGSDREPVAVNSINAGADIVLFSGDKLLGGPQSGIIIGRKELVARIDRNPLMRALRVDKLTLAALQATLQLYRRPQSLNHALPLAVLIATPIAELRQRAERIVEGLRDLAPNVRVSIVEASAYIGGGSCPGQEIESVAVRIESTQLSEKRLASRLRTVRPAVVPRVRDEAVLIDLRGVFPDQDAMLQGSIRAALLGSEIAQDGSSS